MRLFRSLSNFPPTPFFLHRILYFHSLDWTVFTVAEIQNNGTTYRLIAWLLDWLIDWLINGLIDWLIDWLIHRLIDCLIDWLLDWLMRHLIYWIIYMLIDWLSDLLIEQKAKNQTSNSGSFWSLLSHMFMLVDMSVIVYFLARKIYIQH